jgi:hypothetical protein
MKTASMIGSFIVTIAMVFYSLGFSRERKRQLITSGVLSFYTIGISLDITATIFMIMGSTKGLVTPHGLIGYSSLLGMFIDTFILWKHNMKRGSEEPVSHRIHLYSRIAYIWWIIAYITGGLLVALSKIHGYN